MARVTRSTPDLSLVVGPDDSVFPVGPCAVGSRRGLPGADARASVHVVVHRGHGLWTHVYRVLEDGDRDRILVHLEKVFPGDRTAEARAWAGGRFGAPT